MTSLSILQKSISAHIAFDVDDGNTCIDITSSLQCSEATEWAAEKGHADCINCTKTLIETWNKLVSWSLTFLFSTNMEISETKIQE